MSEIIYSHKDLLNQFGNEANLGQVFQQIEKELQVRNEVVCQFKINGLALDEADEKRLAVVGLSEVEILEVKSQKPSSLLGEVLINWVQQIPGLIQQNDELANDIRFKGIEGQLKKFVDLVDGSQLLIDSIISINNVFPNLSLVKSESWLAAEKQTARTIGQALEAFQKKDFTQLADVLGYDMGHSLQTWMELLEGLKKEIKDNTDVTDYIQGNSEKISGKGLTTS